MMKAVVSGIEWKTDGEDIHLPDIVTIDVDAEDTDDDIVNKVSDEYGWLISLVGSISRKGES